VIFAVVGIGINCCQQEGDFPEEIRNIAGSLSSVSGQVIDRAKVAAAMMDALYRMDQSLLSGKEAMLHTYRRDCITLGKAVSLVRGEEVRHGTALDIDDDGALLVRLPDGIIETVNSGEVSVRGMYGYV
jgi:BirA family biotin operon repressor/biotin-[acetyl-CoA-carboxylase] ligase